VVLNFAELTNHLTAASRQVCDGDGRPVNSEPLEDTDGVYEQFPEQFHDVADALCIRRILPGGKVRLADLLADVDELFSHQDVPVVATHAALAGTRETARCRLRALPPRRSRCRLRTGHAPTG
jgi:hypothetical protein